MADFLPPLRSLNIFFNHPISIAESPHRGKLMPATQASFAQKALTAILGGIGLILTTFFIWLATTVIDIRERVVRIETTAKALSDARDRDVQSTGARNAARIDRLEGAERNGRDGQ